MTKGNQLQLFYHDGAQWVTFGYATANSLSYSNETASISSKDHGKHPEAEVTGSSWSCSGSMLFSATDANKVMTMAQNGDAYSIAFGMIAEADWADGLKSVTGINTNTSWSPSTSFIKYGDAIVTSASITANDGETCTMDVEFTGSGILSSTAPATPKSYS